MLITPANSGPNVQKLIASTDGDRPRDIRDRAILMLLSIYGFRSGEIAQLRLEDLDWEREIIDVYRSKQRITQSFPLTYTIGTAILRYLKQVRSKVKRRNVFLTLRAPFRPISAGGMYHVVSGRISQLGIRPLHIEIPNNASAVQSNRAFVSATRHKNS